MHNYYELYFVWLTGAFQTKRSIKNNKTDADLSHLVAEVEGPSKVKIPAEIVECSGEESTYSVRFVPKVSFLCLNYLFCFYIFYNLREQYSLLSNYI